VFVLSAPEWTRALASITRPIGWVRQAVKATGGKGPPRSALIASSAPWHYSARVGRALATRIVPTLRLDAAMPIDAMVAQLNEWQPVSMATYPSVLRELAAAQIAGALKIRLQVIASSAEVLTAETRAAVQRAWGDITLQDTYGATEYAPIATECLHGRKHLFEDGAIIEVVDDDGRAVPPGEMGTRLLLTIFERHTQPLIRYEISDRVRLTGEPCPCGRPFRVIECVEGRQEDVLYFDPAGDRGRSPGARRIAVHPNKFHDALERFAVTAWQVVHDDPALSVRLLGANDESLRAAIESELRAMLESAGARAPDIEILAVDQLERGATGKAPLILSRRRSAPE
jgi:phenylacetate-coenzyme A ligase PaaK-like adenylate-forming protein